MDFGRLFIYKIRPGAKSPPKKKRATEGTFHTSGCWLCRSISLISSDIYLIFANSTSNRSALASIDYTMLRALSGKRGESHSSNRYGRTGRDFLSQSIDQLGDDEDEDHDLMLYSDVEEDVRDFELRQSENAVPLSPASAGKHSSTPRKSKFRRSKRKESSTPETQPPTAHNSPCQSPPSLQRYIQFSNLHENNNIINKNSHGNGNWKYSVSEHLHGATPVHTVEMRPPGALVSESAPDLEGIIRAFAKKRNKVQRSKMRHRHRIDHNHQSHPTNHVFPASTYNDEGASSSSYQSGFSSKCSSSSGSASSQSNRGHSTALLATRKAQREKFQSLQSGNNNSTFQKLNVSFVSPKQSRINDSEIPRNANITKGASMFARHYGSTREKRKNRHIGGGGLPGCHSVAAFSECDVISSGCGDDDDASDARSRRSFSPGIISFTRSLGGRVSKVSSLWSRQKRNMGKEHTAKVDSSERTEESVASNVVNVKDQTKENTTLYNVVVKLSNEDISNEGLLDPQPPVGSTQKTKMLTASFASMNINNVVRGFDCDTGAFATEANLSRSNVLPANSRLVKSKRQKKYLGKTFEQRAVCNTTPAIHIINPMDMQTFLNASSSDEEKGGGNLDDVSSLSSCSFLSLSPRSVMDEQCFESRTHVKRATESSSVLHVRAKSSMSSRISSRGYESLNESCDEHNRSKVRSGSILSTESLTHGTFNPMGSPDVSYSFPFSLRVESTQRSISILLVDPALKVFEIVSVGVCVGSTVGAVIQSAVAAAADDRLSSKRYVGLCAYSSLVYNLEDSVSKLLPKARKQQQLDSHHSVIKNDDTKREGMERTLFVAVPDHSNSTDCVKIRRMLWKNPKLQLWWQAIQKGKSSQSSVSSMKR